jgi:two-component system response regulator
MSARPSILLVEDNPDDEMLARRAFRAESREEWVTVARDGGEAIDCVTGADVPPSLVLLDLTLPGTGRGAAAPS